MNSTRFRSISIALVAIGALTPKGVAHDDPPQSGSTAAVVKGLRSDLESKSSAKRLAASRALAELGPEAAAAVPELCLAMLDRDERVRRSCVWLFQRLTRLIRIWRRQLCSEIARNPSGA